VDVLGLRDDELQSNCGGRSNCFAGGVSGEVSSVLGHIV
jgi:hypothetical protein